MIRKYIALIAVAGIMAACDSPLDTNPTASIDAGTALNTARGIDLAFNGAYRSLQTSSLWGKQVEAYGDLYADGLIFTGTFAGDREVSIRAVTPLNAEVGGMWSSGYIGINRANFILDGLPNVSDATEAKKAQYRGEALFIRALMYAELTKYYGGLPLVEHPYDVLDESIQVPRATQQETYAFIVKDLEEAATLLSSAKNPGRATQGAANALLARVYLEMGDNAKAVAKSTAVINNTLYKLLPKYDDLWTNANRNSTESIFDIQYTTLNANAIAFWFAPTAAPTSGRYGYAPSPGMIAAYEPGDLRKASSIAIHPNGQPWVFKWRQIASGAENISVLRLAEQYLIRAEANARLGAPAATVLADVNVIRARAGLPALDPAVVNTQTALLDAILQERRVELAFEGFRFADLRRFGKALTILGVPATKLLWPVPQYEIDVNPNLVQNAGY